MNIGGHRKGGFSWLIADFIRIERLLFGVKSSSTATVKNVWTLAQRVRIRNSTAGIEQLASSGNYADGKSKDVVGITPTPSLTVPPSALGPDS